MQDDPGLSVRAGGIWGPDGSLPPFHCISPLKLCGTNSATYLKRGQVDAGGRELVPDYKLKTANLFIVLVVLTFLMFMTTKAVIQASG